MLYTEVTISQESSLFYGTFILSTHSSVIFLVSCERSMEEEGNGGCGSYDIDILSVDKHSHSCLFSAVNSHGLSAFNDGSWWTEIHFICRCSCWAVDLLSLPIRGLNNHEHMDNTIWICWVIKRGYKFGKKMCWEGQGEGIKRKKLTEDKVKKHCKCVWVLKKYEKMLSKYYRVFKVHHCITLEVSS